jgi:hypothetical protein
MWRLGWKSKKGKVKSKKGKGKSKKEKVERLRLGLKIKRSSLKTFCNLDS